MPNLTGAWIPILVTIIAFVILIVAATVGLVRLVQARRGRRSPPSRGHFVFVKIMDQVGAMERNRKYGKPLNEALQAHGVGIVTGGGVQMDRSNTQIAWIGLDVELFDLETGPELLRQHLRDIGVPAGSTIEYRTGDKKIILEINESGTT